MTKTPFYRWLPILWTLLLSILLLSWAAYEEGQVQESIYLPGGLTFQAFLPSRYSIYCEMEDDLTNKEAILSNMRLFPTIACEVRGADHLDVLRVDVWRAGGLTRFVKDKRTGKNRMLMPFAEFEILWPGYYGVKAGFIGLGSKRFLMTVGPTGLLGSAAILSLVMLMIAFLWQIRRNIEIDQDKKELAFHVEEIEESHIETDKEIIADQVGNVTQEIETQETSESVNMSGGS